MTRESPYAVPHKGLRNALGRFQALAGSTRYDDAFELERLKARGVELAMLLTHHLVNENRFYLEPLRARAEAAALHDVHDHERLEPLQRAWVSRLERLEVTSPGTEAHAFYLAVTEFHSAYLAHLLHEERVTERVMFEHFTDDEVAAMSAAIFAHVEVPVLVASLRYIIPALPLGERRAMLDRVRGAPFFPEVVAALADELTPVAFEELDLRAP